MARRIAADTWLLPFTRLVAMNHLRGVRLDRMRTAYLFDVWMKKGAWVSDPLRRLDTRLAKSHTTHVIPGWHLDGDSMACWGNGMTEGGR